MADDPTTPDETTDPGDAFDLDVALSAELDGALDAYADEIGRPAEEIAGALTTPAAVERRTELTAARAALAAPLMLDEVTRRRLLAAAVPADARAPRRDRGAWFRGAAAAAVTLIVLGGVVAIARSGDSGGGDASRAGSGGTSKVEAVAPTGDLGDLGALDQDAIDGLFAPSGSAAAGRERARQPAGDSGTANSAERSAAVPDFAEDAQAAYALTTCDAALTAGGGAIRFRAAGTYQGVPALVLGVDLDGRTIVFVVAADDCARVLYSASR